MSAPPSSSTARNPAATIAAALPILCALSAATGCGRESPTPPAHSEPLPLPEAVVQRLLTMSPLPAHPPADPSNAHADDPAAAHLGRWLFFDARLSGPWSPETPPASLAELAQPHPTNHPADDDRSGGVSCASCHRPELAFTDGRAIAQGLGPGRRHTPSLLNTAHNRWFNWDGRRDSHWAQAIEAIERPNEMGSNRLAIARLVHHDPPLRAAYTSIFGPPPDLSPEAPANARPAHDDDPDDAHHPDVIAWQRTSQSDRAAADEIIANLAKALAAYQRQLISRDAPFDTFVRALRDHDHTLIATFNPQELRGAELFAGPASCWQCHHGPNLSDGEFHNIMTPLRTAPNEPPKDPGRFAAIPVVRADPFNAQGTHADDPTAEASRRLEYLDQTPLLWGAFKTPSLRSVARTAPYFHNAVAPDLAAVLHHYNTFEDAPRVGHGHRDPLLQPLNLPPEDLAALEAFLRTLTGTDPDPTLLTPPKSPSP
ncbi:MAG: cytochrome-c peroxidase [Phycisphaerales bacterium]